MPRRSTLFPVLSARAPSMRDVDLWDAPSDGLLPGAGERTVPGDFVAHPPKQLGGSPAGRGGSRERMMVSLQRWPAAATQPGAAAAEAVPSPRVGAADFKPRFLRRVEERLDEAEAMDGDGSVELSETAMELYRHTFDRLIEEFRTYGPALSRIKSAYERSLQQYRDRIVDMEPEVARLGRLQSERDREIAQATRSRDQEIRELNGQLHDLREAKVGAARLRRAHNALKEEHGHTLTQLANTKAEMTAQHDISKSLVKTIERFEEITRARDEIENATLNSGFTAEQRLIKLTKELQDSMEHNDKLQNQLEQRTAALTEARELHAQLSTKFARCDKERAAIMADYQKTRSQYRTLRKRMRQGTAKGGDGTKMDPETGRPLTARPEWDEVQKAMPQMPFDTSAIVTSGTTEAASMIAEWLTKLSYDLKEAEAALPWKTQNEDRLEEMKRQREAQANGDGGFTGKWFVCQGTGHNVPKFLRFNGKVRNRMMSKRDTEVFINEFWEHKIKADTRPKSKKQSVPDHIHNFMKSRFGVQATIAEFAYNFCDALQRYRADADCEIFHLILFGELAEECYHAQMKMIQDLLDACEKKDKFEHGGKVLAVLPREHFNTTLNDFLVSKSPADMQALKQALSYDQPLADVGYSKIFEENRDGDQGKFAEALRDQHLADTMQTYRLIETEIRIAAAVADGEDEQLAEIKLASGAFNETTTSNFAEGGGENEYGEDADADAEEEQSQQTTLGVIKQALRKHDKGMPDSVIDRIIAAGVSGKPPPEDLVLSETPELYSDYRKVSIDEFAFNIRCIYIPRHSRIAKAEAEAEAVPPRQLSAEEQQLLHEAYEHVNVTQKGGLTLAEVQRAIGVAYTVSVSDAYMQEFAKEFAVADAGAASSAGAEPTAASSASNGSGEQTGEHLYTFNQCVLGVVKCPAFSSLDEIFEWRKTFDKFDADHSGTIDVNELEEMVEEMVGDNAPVDEVMDDMGLPETEVPWMEFCMVMLRLNGMPSKDLFVSRPAEPQRVVALAAGQEDKDLSGQDDDLASSP
jgi:hypothetical protein